MFRGFLEIYWTDPRLAGREIEAEGVPADIWRPRIAACPGLKMPEAEAYKQLPTFFKKDPVSDGRVKMVIPMAFGDEGWERRPVATARLPVRRRAHRPLRHLWRGAARRPTSTDSNLRSASP